MPQRAGFDGSIDGNGAAAISAHGYFLDVVDAFLARLAGVFLPRIAQILDVAGTVEIGAQFLLRFGNVDAVVELVLDPGDRRVEDQVLFFAGRLLFDQARNGGMAGRGKQAERHGGGNLERLHGVSPFVFLPAFFGPVGKVTGGARDLIQDSGITP